YVFQLSGPGLSQPIEVTKSLRAFTLNDFAGQLYPGATYNVRVRMVFNFSDPDGPFGKVCTIVTPGLSRNIAQSSAFDAIAHPNPFAESFNLSLKGASASHAIVKIYDMTGGLLEARTIKAGDTFTAGEAYPAGVYN